MQKIFGKIVRGSGRGKQLGFPTANIFFDGELPVEYGVYACLATVAGKRLQAAVSVGVNEMFDAKVPTVEAYFLDFSGDIYGENVEIEFVKRLRAMQRFATVDELKVQIKKDVEKVRQVLSGTPTHSLSLRSAARRAASLLSSLARPPTAVGGHHARSGRQRRERE